MRRHQVAIRTVIAVITMLLLAGCASGAAVTPAPAASASVPLPPLTPQPEATPIPSHSATTPAPGRVGLVARLTWNNDEVVPIAGTTVLDDGRVIWNRDGDPVERRLTDEGLAWVRAQLDQTGLLAATRSYGATLRPGATPDPRGTTSYLFQLVRDGSRVKVGSGDPGDYLPPDAWVIPPEMQILSRLAGGLRDPEAWIAESMWSAPAGPFDADHYAVVLDSQAGPPNQGQYPVDVSEVRWPFRIATAGMPLAQGGQPSEGRRCLVVDATVAKAMADAEAEVGRPRDLGAWMAGGAYRWDAVRGNLGIETMPLLPYQSPDCSDALTW